MRKVRLSVLGCNESLLGTMELDMDAMEQEYMSTKQTKEGKVPVRETESPKGRITGDFEVWKDGVWTPVQFAPMPRVRPRTRKPKQS